MSDIEQHEATPRAELERQIMDPNVSKNEREWWAAADIERLRGRLNEVDAQLTAESHIHAKECMALRAEKDSEIEQLQERIYTLIAERDAERKIYNDAIASHLAEIERLRAEAADRIKKVECLWALGDARKDEIERLRTDNGRLWGLLNEVRIQMKNQDRRESEEPLYRMICQAVEESRP